MWRCDSLSSFPGDCSQILSSPGGLEPPTFRLTAERANQLRHEGLHMSSEKQKNNISIILLVYTRNN